MRVHSTMGDIIYILFPLYHSYNIYFLSNKISLTCLDVFFHFPFSKQISAKEKINKIRMYIKIISKHNRRSHLLFRGTLNFFYDTCVSGERTIKKNE